MKENKKYILEKRKKQVYFPPIMPKKELDLFLKVLEDVASRVRHRDAFDGITGLIDEFLTRAKMIEDGHIDEDGKCVFATDEDIDNLLKNNDF